MANQNALIALAIVSENAKNPYATFCEYIKYCVFTYVKDKMTISELQNAIGQEFGLCIPHNVIVDYFA